MTYQEITINGFNIAPYIEKNSWSISYLPIQGLPEMMTMDLALHDDLLGYRRAFSFSLNGCDSAQVQIIASLFRSASVTVVLKPFGTGPETIKCKPSFPKAAMKIERANGESFWKLDDITLTEREGVAIE